MGQFFAHRFFRLANVNAQHALWFHDDSLDRSGDFCPPVCQSLKTDRAPSVEAPFSTRTYLKPSLFGSRAIQGEVMANRTLSEYPIPKPSGRVAAKPSEKERFDLGLLAYRRNLKAYACSLVRDIELAEDLVQDTLLRALANRDKLRLQHQSSCLAVHHPEKPVPNQTAAAKA